MNTQDDLRAELEVLFDNCRQSPDEYGVEALDDNKLANALEAFIIGRDKAKHDELLWLLPEKYHGEWFSEDEVQQQMFTDVWKNALDQCRAVVDKVYGD